MDRGIGDMQALLRSVGGLLLAVGCVVVLSRRSGAHHWSKFELTLLIAAPTGLLYGLAIYGAPRAGAVLAEAWRSVLLVSAVLLAPVALFLFLDWAGASTNHLLYDAGVLIVTGALAIAGARRVRAGYAVLPGGLALLGAWILIWAKIIHDPSAETVRWLLLCGGALLLVGAAAIAYVASRAVGAVELAVAGAIGALSAGILGVFVSGFGTLAGLAGSSSSESSVTVESSGTSSSSGNGRPTVTEHVIHRSAPSHLPGLHISGAQTLGWDIYLLVLSLGLVWFGARMKARGLGYVGAFGLLFFTASVGAQISHELSGHAPSSSLAGWPLVLVVLGVAGLAASWTRPGRRTGRA
jgi:hypothetical protein